MTPEIFQDLPAITLVAFFLYLMIRWVLTTTTKQIEQINTTVKHNTLAQMETYKLLLIHDAQIRGVNPTAGKDMTDAHTKAASEYEKVLAGINNLQDIIKTDL